MQWQPGLDGGDHEPRTLVNSVRICLRKYDGFSGRAPRAEYWWFTLANMLVQIVTIMVSTLVWGPGLHTGGAALRGVVSLLLLLPGLAVSVRRLHDTDRSGWWVLLPLLPVAGAIILIVWFATRGTRGPNRFGPENGVV
jgi:uncharacterized membrane protein YhaH (DUF805 family)